MPPTAEQLARRNLTNKPLGRTLLRLAVPVAADSAIRSLYNLADAFWLGRWSKEGLAAVGVSMPFFFITIAFGMGFGTAGTSLVSQLTGANRHEEAERAAAQTLLFMFTLALCFSVPLAIWAPQLFDLVQVPENAQAEAISYIRIMCAGLPLIAFIIAYGSVLRGLGDTTTVLVIGAVNNILNVIIDPFLIFGWAGLPAMGAAGAALAGVISLCTGTVAAIICMKRQRAGLALHFRDFKPDWDLLKRIARIGFPAALNNSSASIGFASLQVMINALGTAVIGAFTIGLRVIFFFNIPGHAVAAAAAPVVGQALGARRPKLARRSIWMGSLLVAVVMFLPLVFLIWQGGLVASAFTDNPAVQEEARLFFLAMPAASYFFSVLMVLTAAFFGSGHTTPAMVVGILRSFLLRLPLAYLFAFVLGWESLGIYIAWIVGNVISALVTLYLFRRGGWQKATIHTRTPEPPPPEGGSSG